MKNSFFSKTVLGIGLLLTSSSVWAAGGVYQIHQACAINTGCFEGDSAGFPVTISSDLAAHSFQLTSDLQPTNHAILIAADHTTIDLNGFTIMGVSGSRGAVVRSGSSSSAQGTHLFNGVITGIRSNAIDLGANSLVEDLIITDTNGDAIRVGLGSTVRNTVIADSQGNGIVAEAGSLIEGNTITDSRDNGIVAEDGSLIVSNVVRQSNDWGLMLGATAGYRGNVLTENNGGNAQLQLEGGIALGDNVCGADIRCVPSN